MYDKHHLNGILAEIARFSYEAFGDKLEAVILYGSYARGDYDAESDIDVMVLADVDAELLHSYEKSFSRLASRLSLEDEDCTTISLLLKDKATFERYYDAIPFYQSIKREGVEISA